MQQQLVELAAILYIEMWTVILRRFATAGKESITSPHGVKNSANPWLADNIRVGI